MARHSVSTAISRLLCLAFLLPSLVTAISPISIKGTKLYDEDGKQFFVKGVAYAPESASYKDMLVNSDQCQIDAGLIKSLGANTIRVYSVDGTENHDDCMRAFANQGIYVWVELATAKHAISRTDTEWTMALYNNWTATVDAFAGYDNTLAFGVGSEVMNDADNSGAAAYVKAATRDIKAFRNARGYRPIPISYSADDRMEGRVVTGDYLTCGDQDDSIELFGMNVYSWCGNSSYYTSGYDELYEQFQSFNIPMVFAETGCKTNDNDRDFSEVETMLGPVFQALFSGSIVYEWAMDQSGYGIVKYSNDDHTGFPSTLDEYNALATVFSSVEPAGTTVTDYTPSNSPRACPTSDSSLWELDPDKALPTINGLDVDTVTARTTIISTTQTGSGERGAATNTEGGSPPDEGTDHSSTLSKGAVAGVAVGCVIAVLVIGLIATLLFIRRRNAKNQKMSEKAQPGSQEDSPQGDSSGVGGHEQLFKAELPAASVGRIMPRQEMDASQLPQGLQDYYGPGKDKDGSVANGTNESDTTAQGRSQTYEMEGSTPPMSELPGRSH